MTTKYFFKPFVGVAISFGMNKTESTITSNGPHRAGDGEKKSKSKVSIGGGVQCGARARIMATKMYASFSYRYLYLGKVNWVDSIGNLNLTGKRYVSGFTLGLMYLI